jgi:ribonuclease HII
MLKPFFTKKGLEAGCDEAGRGCLAGPVYAAAVILTKDFYHPLLNDSKQLSLKKRLLLREVIEHESMAFAVESVSAAEIDRINILNASILAMHRAISKLKVSPSLLLIDGNRFKSYGNIKHSCIIKGDAIYASIAAASVLAKTYRDDYMLKIHTEYPAYGWNKNMGYPTAHHRNAIAEHGVTPHHRLTYRLTNRQLNIPFTDI